MHIYQEKFLKGIEVKENDKNNVLYKLGQTQWHMPHRAVIRMNLYSLSFCFKSLGLYISPKRDSAWIVNHSIITYILTLFLTLSLELLKISKTPQSHNSYTSSPPNSVLLTFHVLGSTGSLIISCAEVLVSKITNSFLSSTWKVHGS